MDLLGGYGSDDSSDEEAAGVSSAAATAAATTAAANSSISSLAEAAGVASKRRKIDFSKLPLARPLDFSAGGGDGKGGPEGEEGEAPLKRAAAMDLAAKSAIGKNLLAALPPPKATLGAEGCLGGGGGSGARLDLGGFTRREKPRTTVGEIIRLNGSVEDVAEDPSSIPEKMAKHPMFNTGLKADGPSQEDLAMLKKEPKFISIDGKQMQDPDWYMNNQINGNPGLHKGKSVPEEISMYEAKSFKKTTHAEPSRIQKRKHQINSLAAEAIEAEAEMLDRNASGRLSKAQTSLKYGW